MRNSRVSNEFDDYEEEMIRLASEISLVETIAHENDFEDDFGWGPTTLIETEEEIRQIEEFVDEHLTGCESVHDFNDEDDNNNIFDRESHSFGDPLSNDLIADIFHVQKKVPLSKKGASPGNTPRVMFDDGSHSFRSESTDFASPRSTFSGFPNTPRTPAAYDAKPQTSSSSLVAREDANIDSHRGSTGRDRDQQIKDTVATISGKLKWYQNKIAQTIETTNEVSSAAVSCVALNLVLCLEVTSHHVV